MWWEVLLGLATGTGFLAVAGWILFALGRRVLDQVLTMSATRFEADLRARSDQELERLRTELRLAERQTSRVHEKAFEAISDLYEALAETQELYELWTRRFREGDAALDGAMDEDGRRAVEAHRALQTLLSRRRLWLGKDLADQFDRFMRDLQLVWAGFGDPDDRDWKATHERISNSIPALRAELENRLREFLLGDLSEAASAG